MVTKTVTYTDYNGTSRTEDFMFNLNEAEIIEMNFINHGGLIETIDKIIASKEMPELIKVFKDLVLKSYGEKSKDGRHFMKNEDITKSFEASAAYPIIFTELARDAKSASAFINGLLPTTFDKEKDKIVEVE